MAHGSLPSSACRFYSSGIRTRQPRISRNMESVLTKPARCFSIRSNSQNAMNCTPQTRTDGYLSAPLAVALWWLWPTRSEVIPFGLSALAGQPGSSRQFMRKANQKLNESVDTSDIPEVDFRGGVRGKHYLKFREAPVVYVVTESTRKSKSVTPRRAAGKTRIGRTRKNP